MSNTHEQAIVIALCRCALAGNPTDATRHQVLRLRDFHLKDNPDMAAKLHQLLYPEPHEMDGMKIVKS